MKKIMIVSAAVAMLVGGAIGVNVMADDKDDVTLEKVTPAVQKAKEEVIKRVQPETQKETEEIITLEQAKDIVLKKVGNGVIEEAEAERDYGEVVYEIEVKTNEYEYDFKINQEGKILKEEKEKRDDDRKMVKKDQSGSISFISAEKAKTIALKEVNGEIDDLELEHEDGRYIYEVEIERNNGDDVTVYIDAVTGKVIYVELD